MNLLRLLFLLIVLSAFGITAGFAADGPGGSSGRADRVRQAALSIQRKSWEQGILSVAFMEEGRTDLVVQMVRSSLIYLSKDGVPAALDGAPADPLMLGEALVLAEKSTDDAAMKSALRSTLQFVLQGAPRAADGTVYHVDRAIWSDSFNTTPPFLASAGHYDEALKQIEGHWKRLWNPKARLLAHIWDEEYCKLADPKFWGGGNGWAAAALARVIRMLPAERKADRERLAGDLKALIDGCLAHQTASGLFHDVIDDAQTFEETNLAQMLAYSIYESVRGGWLPADYLKAAHRMREAAEAKVDKDGFVRGACGAPEFQRPGISAEAQAFFLMMEAAAEKARAAGFAI
jgi:rhamnogalacturonyl hydrolase YesR